MFRTEHLEGRLLYETDKVVCINVFINRRYTDISDDVYLFQILISLANYKYCSKSFEFTTSFFSMSYADIEEELSEGVKQYLLLRKDLGLDN